MENDGDDVGMADINEAVRLLSSVLPTEVKLSVATFLKKKLYRGTRLDDIKEEEPEEQVLRKNIYYLARHTKRINVLTIQFTQLGFFTLDEKESIEDAGADLSQAIKFYAAVIEQDPEHFGSMLEVFRLHGNDHIADILEGVSIRAGDNPKRSNPAQTDRTKSISFQTAARATKTAWTCGVCTFVNHPAQICCIMCNSRCPDSQRNFKPDLATADANRCDFCLTPNPHRSTSCAGCGGSLKNGSRGFGISRAAEEEEFHSLN